MKIGETIAKLRKENNMTQEDLAKLLNVSSKTISKWECGNSVPDIILLKEISDTFKISIDDLLDGNIINYNSKKKFNKWLLIPVILIFLLGIILIVFKPSKENEEGKIDYCKVIRTFNVLNVSNSNDEEYLYLTVSEFQTEGVYTVKISKLISKDIKENNNYEFTFKIDNNYIPNVNNYISPEVLFTKYEVLDVKYTDKVGVEQESRVIC